MYALIIIMRGEYNSKLFYSGIIMKNPTGEKGSLPVFWNCNYFLPMEC